MTPTLAQALQKALELEKQGCISSTAMALIVLMNAIKDHVGSEENFQSLVNGKERFDDYYI